MALAHIFLATLPITEYSGSIPLEKKKDKLGPGKGRHQDPQSGHYYYWEGYVESVWNMAYGEVSNELTYLQCSRMLTPMARKRGLR